MTSSPQTIELYLVDDQAILRAALRSRLNEYEGFQVVGESGDPRAAIDEIGRMKPHVVILDVAMRGLSGIDLIGRIRKLHPHGKIVMLTQHEGESFVIQAIEVLADLVRLRAGTGRHGLTCSPVSK